MNTSLKQVDIDIDQHTWIPWSPQKSIIDTLKTKKKGVQAYYWRKTNQTTGEETKGRRNEQRITTELQTQSENK